MQIQDLDPTTELHSIKRGLRASPFADSLAITPLKTIAEFRERVARYIKIEEV